jgi:hypothetical protein
MFTTTRRPKALRPWLKALLTFAAASAVLASAPIATADPDPSPSPSPSPDDQQQDQGPGMPKLPKAPNNNNQSNGARNGDLADKNCWVIDGVPTWNAPGTAPRAIGPGETAVPCYYVYGLQPH